MILKTAHIVSMVMFMVSFVLSCVIPFATGILLMTLCPVNAVLLVAGWVAWYIGMMKV